MTLGRVFVVVALVLFVLLGLAGSGWIIQGHKELLWALIGWGLAAKTAAELVP